MADSKSGQSYETPESSIGGYGSPDPVERLQRLQSELTQSQAEVNKWNEHSTNLQADIDSLTSMVNEVKQITGAYAGIYKGIEKDRDDLSYFVDTKSRMANAAIGEKKEPLEQKIRNFDHHLQEMAGHVERLRDRSTATEREYNEATTERDAKQKEYDEIKSYQTTVQQQITDLKALKDQITKADDATDIPSMYFLIQEFKHALQRVRVLSQQRLSEELNNALSELESAKEKLRHKTVAWQTAKADYEQQHTNFQDAVKNRRTNILKLIQEAWPVEPPAAPSTPAPANTK